MGESRGYRVVIQVKDATGAPTGVARDLERYDAESRESLIAMILALAKEPARHSRPSPGYQRLEFPLVLPNGEARYFVCPFQYLPDEERIEIRRIFEMPL